MNVPNIYQVSNCQRTLLRLSKVSLSTGCGDAGTHFNRTVTFFQAALQRSKQTYTFKNLDDSVCVYDSFFEILPDRLNRLNERLSAYNYDVDLYATKTERNCAPNTP